MSVEPPVLYLVEFKMGDYGPCAECYTFYVNDDHPITIHNRIMAFSHPCWVSSHPTWVRWVLAHADCTFTKLPDTKLSVPTKIYAVIDFPAALETVKHKDNAKTDNLLNCLNTILDCVDCIEVIMPREHRKLLERLADHLTFDRNLSNFFSEQGLDRQAVVDAIDRSLRKVSCSLAILA